MKRGIRLGLIFFCGLAIAAVLWWVPGDRATAYSPSVESPPAPFLYAQANEAASENDGGSNSTPNASTPVEPGNLKPFDDVVRGLTVSTGLFTIYHDLQRNRALLGLKPSQLNQNLLFMANLESGLGELGLFRGWPVNDLMIQFRQIPDNRIQVAVPNVYFRDPQPQAQRLLRESFGDSVLTTLPIQAIHGDTGEILLDLKDFLISRDPANLSAQFPWALGSYAVSAEASYLGPVKAFPNNIELEAVMGFSGGGSTTSPFSLGLSSLPDSRGFNLRVRYSLSAIPKHPTFHARQADERVGYFITAYRSPGRPGISDPFVRYIHRWYLEKQDPAAALSPPKEPLVFWVENTTPVEYRAAIADGVNWWNAAFERAGFTQAIDVRQMPDNADWDPADVRYNVIRWSDSLYPWASGLGPARVNPLTGEILDADIILDASIVRDLALEYDTLATGATSMAGPMAGGLSPCGHPLGDRLMARLSASTDRPRTNAPQRIDAMDYCAGLRGVQTTAFGSLAVATLAPPFSSREAKETYIQQYLRVLTAHEVGHVLGLRHNFLGSTLLSPTDLNDPARTQSQGMASSVMDYLPPNLAPPGQPQGDYFPTQLGPYDLWAIEYGYRPVSNPITAQRELRPIADRAGAAELAYAPDEDVFAMLDPMASPWDMSDDPLSYAEGQMAIAKTIWDRLDWYSVNPGEGYGQLRQRVNLVFFHYDMQATIIANYIGGQRFTRTDPWSSGGQAPFAPIAAAEQRRALDVLNQRVFAPDALTLSPELINRLAPDRWMDWGQDPFVNRIDYPIYDRLLFTQAFTVSNLLDGYRLLRLRDSEFNQPSGEAFTLAELFDTLGQSIWAEVLNPPAQSTAISSLRQGLQRHYLNTLTSLVLRNHGSGEGVTNLLGFVAQEFTAGAPEEARVLARYQLRQLQEAIARHLRQGQRLDVATVAYLEDASDRIVKVLDAPLRGQ
ncbi:zinc-dependent metalloprotease [Nodosilinea sp. LEGE 07298]|uniref:zinc-dependent metalloprotease n=1 Tax=Nodosilinea sp. LEGE 07298 TaxID=2777970 RepID=UPI0018811693|nr:zinc-dependent metalloprotease [Nodosilinea sp. LEGE 07298]MBE9108630.1 zinc-dependent metalloprotease [Nodosilinea sp. LEGE 07298]